MSPGVDFKCLPPCENTLMKKIARTHNLTKMIKEAQKPHIEIELNDGWKTESGKMSIEYYSGETYPGDISQITNPILEESDDEYFSDEESDTDNESDQ